MPKRLVIISHTPHYYANGQYYGWGPTVREINNLAKEFDAVLHFAPLHNQPMPGGNLPYTATNIRYIKLLEAGGESAIDKLKILLYAPINVFTIFKSIKRSDWIQLRAPANIVLIMLPIFSLLRYRRIWVKYAGNWNEPSPAFTYRVQRWWLRKNLLGSYVTVNGKWEKEGKHILAFENPCMNDSDLEKAKAIAAQKQYNTSLNICFIGQLDENKGILNLLDALKMLTADEIKGINKLTIVGDGHLRDAVAIRKKNVPINVEQLGYLNHDEIYKIYTQAHINILPSKSEGFPKVIAEGAAYGCIPVVTDMSSLSQYINENNGLLLTDNTPATIYKAIQTVLAMSVDKKKQLGMNAAQVADKFTYEYYIKRIATEIVSK